MKFVFLVFALVSTSFAQDPFKFETANFTLEDNDYRLTEIADDSETFWDIVDVDEVAERIIGGAIAPQNKYPYQAGILLRLPRKRAWCGGSVISAQYILTAAHCIDDALSATVILGAHNRQNNGEEGRISIETKPEDFILHEYWSPKKLEADIALIHLKEPITFSETIQSIILPFSEYETQYFDNSQGIVSGWGKYQSNCAKLSVYLRFYQSRIMHNSECRRYYPQLVGLNHICVEPNAKKRGCEGDSGGPLAVTVENGYPMLVGVTSFGKCCGSKFPTVFTRVTQYLNWITQYTDRGRDRSRPA